MTPASSATSRIAASSGVSPSSRWPLGRHHSSLPPRLRRPMTAACAAPSSTKIAMPPADVSLDTGRRLPLPRSWRRTGVVGVRRGRPWLRVSGRAARTESMTHSNQRGAPGGGVTRSLGCLVVVTTAFPRARRAAPARRGPVGRAARGRRGACRGLRRRAVTSSRWSAGRCGTRSSGGRAPTWTSRRPPARTDGGGDPRMGRDHVGHRAGVRHHRRPQGRHGRRGHDVSGRRVRRATPASPRWRSATASRATWRAATSR